MTDHDDLDARLTDALGRSADGVDAEPDTADLLRRVDASATRRQRLLGVGLALALVVGPLVGYQAGTGQSSDDAGVAAGETASDDGSTTEGDARHPTPTMTTTTVAVGDAGAAGGAPVPFAPPAAMGTLYGGPELDRVGNVTIGDVTIRLYRAAHGNPDLGNPTWDPPPGCFPTSTVVGEASTASIVGIASAQLFGLAPTEGAVVAAGVAEGDPHWLAVGSTDASEVTVRFSDGQEVPAQVVGGVFAAAAPAPTLTAGDEAVWDPAAVVVADGATHEIRSWAVHQQDEEFWRQCEPPPPSLPDPGQQPDDPDAARAAIVAAYEQGYGGGDDALGAFEDPDYLAPVMEDVDESEIAQQYAGQLDPDVGEIVFDTPTHAWLFYDLDPVFSQRIGEAVLTDRGWKVATATICADVAMAGVECP